MYKRNFLKEVILRVDFSNPISNMKQDSLESFKKLFGQDVTSSSEKRLKGAQIDLEKESTKFEIVGTEATYLLNDGKKIVLFNNFYSVSDSSFTNFAAFSPIFRKGLSAVQAVFDIKEFNRVGLRYINMLKGLENISTINDWNKYIEAQYLIHPEEFLPTSAGFSLRRGMNDITVSDGQYLINIKYGFYNREFPQKIIATKSEFIIDIDCFISDKIVDIDDLVKKLPEMKNLCESSFERFITQTLRNKLNEE